MLRISTSKNEPDVRTHHERQRQAAEGELLDVGLGDGAAGVDLVAGIILPCGSRN